jgi:hypothetical protein
MSATEMTGQHYLSLSAQPELVDWMNRANFEEGEPLYTRAKLPNESIFFKIRYRRRDSKGFHFRVDGPIYKVQRRESLRLPIPPGMPSRVRWLDEKLGALEGTVADLSEGGIGIRLELQKLATEKFPSLRELQHWHAGARLERVHIEIEWIPPLLIEQSLVLRHIREVSSAKVARYWALGCEWTDRDPTSMKRISSLIFEESFRYIGRI